ncbi:MAG: site-specific DNA-methyltransferase [Proteobacteria bacterium]|nr:site-specific DNA-methyltransferase [Pseudomonadota bacterium]
MRKLYFGDNLAVLRDRIENSSVDLVYLDPPFNSQARYNVLFKSPRQDVATAQAAAFLDFWSWGHEAESAYHELLTTVGGSTASIVQALRSALGESDMMAYLVMMAVRLQELRRVLRPSGSIFLHCDPTASHYLKVLLDAVFGAGGFTNEIIWQRSMGKALMTRRLPSNHDVILFYAGPDAAWNDDQAFLPYDIDTLSGKTAEKYALRDGSGRPYQLTSLINPSSDRPNLTYEFLGVTRVWRWTRERMQDAYERGLVVQTAPGRVPRFKRYLDEQRGVPLSDVWTDIPPLNSQARERIGYPTQKPLALLSRIIQLSSRPDSVVLDPFCGCGTTVHAAELHNRPWVGIDVSIHAVHVIEQRLLEAFGDRRVPSAEGIPADYESAAQLAATNPFQFQWWANYLIGVHRLNEVKRGPDRGVDGEVFFPNGPGRPYGRILTSVKGGKNVTPAMVRELRGVIERENAELGLFICLDDPTSAMEREAVVAGFGNTVHGRIPRLQIVSIAGWFRGERPAMPALDRLPYAAFNAPQKRGRARRPDPNQPHLPLSFIGDKANVVSHLNPALVTSTPQRRDAR